MSEPAQLLFDERASVAFLARVDLHVAALVDDLERYHFLEQQIIQWLLEAGRDSHSTATLEIVNGLIERRRKVGKAMGRE